MALGSQVEGLALYSRRRLACNGVGVTVVRHGYNLYMFQLEGSREWSANATRGGLDALFDRAIASRPAVEAHPNAGLRPIHTRRTPPSRDVLALLAEANKKKDEEQEEEEEEHEKEDAAPGTPPLKPKINPKDTKPITSFTTSPQTRPGDRVRDLLPESTSPTVRELFPI